MGRTPAVLVLPTARLYYERRGSGPLVLLIPGGAQDAGVFDLLAERLRDRYTVAALDPRGNSRSTFRGAPTALDVDRHGEDALAVIQACGGGPAHVLGTSGGAHVALNLCERFPDAVATVVAHEPPSVMLLPDPAPAIAEEYRIHEIYRHEGVEAAMKAFFAANSFGDPQGGDAEDGHSPAPGEGETFQRMSGNLAYWLEHGMLPLSLYRPNIESLRGGQTPIHVAIGDGSKGQPIEAMAEALARSIGVERLSAPGDHIGFMTHPDRFAAIICQAFEMHAGRTSARAN